MIHFLTAALIATVCSIFLIDMAAADTQFVGVEAERIVRQGEILAIEAEINERRVVERHLIVEHDRRLYACFQISDFSFVEWYCVLDEDE